MRIAHIAPVATTIPPPKSGSVETMTSLLTEGLVAVSPGSGFGLDGEGFVRFALVENEQRIGQAMRSLRRGLDRLEAASTTR